MASTSSAATPHGKHDVFLSFRGKDTRDGFISHLYHALRNHDTYMDKKLRGGEEIEPTLLQTIEQSYISVVIFSNNYADSTFCLRELSKILECKEKKGQRVLPVFYQVNPSDVQELSGSFGNALREHERNCNSREVEHWKHALKEIANLKGWDSNVIKPEAKLIQEIVDDIQKKLKEMTSYGSPSTISKRYVGITSRVNEIESLLAIESVPGVLIVGIWGIGGVGKTTTAEAVYHRNSQRFDGYCFFGNVREESKKHGLIHVLQDILREVLQKKDLSIRTKELDVDTKRMLGGRKVLIVLDDVNSCRDLKDLVGEDGLFGQGSRIIVTSRDRQVLKNHCEEDKIYEVKDLDEHDSLQLFFLHAFKQNSPIDEFAQLSKKMLSYVKGIPLVLEVLGCNLYKRSVDDWKSKLAQLERHGDKDVHKTLETCYDELDEIAQKIFLDIACFFGTYNEDVVKQTLDLEERNVFSRLTDMCLIKIIDNNTWMHDILQDLGREIVRRQKVDDDPGKCSRLWEPKDVYHVLKHHQGTKNVETMSIKEGTANEELSLSPTAFKSLNKLRLLDWDHRVHFPNGLEFLSDELRILKWDCYPLKSLPLTFCPEKLVELKMQDSQLEELFNRYPRSLENLKLMDLSGSQKLILADEDLSKVPNLEVLNLRGLSCLSTLPSSIRDCTKLTGLNLWGCKRLRTLPSSIEALSQLVNLHLTSCDLLESLPESIGQLERLEELDLSFCTRLVSLPNSIGQLKCLVKLNLIACLNLTSLPNSIGQLQCLVKLNLSACINLTSLPNSIGQLECLAELNLSCCEKLTSLPNSIGQLDCLAELNLSCCEKLTSLPNSIGQLDCLAELNLSCCKKLTSLPNSIGQLKRLSKLYLHGCTKLVGLPSIYDLESLETLDVSFCWKLTGFPENQLSSGSEETPGNMKRLRKLTQLCLQDCHEFQYLPELPSSLQSLDATCCFSLESVGSIFTQGEEEYEAGSEDFCFDCCHKLDKNSRIKIMGDAQLRIQRMARCLFNQGFGGVNDSTGEQIKFKLLVPGLEIPEWFMHKNSQGSSLEKIKPPPDWNHSNRFLGFALCAVVWFHRSYDKVNVICKCRLIMEGRQRDLHFYYAWHYSIMINEFLEEHVFIWYDYGEWRGIIKSNCSFDEASFHFICTKLDNFMCGNSICNKSRVLKCGVHPLFAQDDQDPRPKRLKKNV